jgi:hypothetical protein
MKQCYLCGEPLKKNNNKSRDHTPPDSIFPNEKPKNLITIPCCIACNAEFAPIDEKMRNFFAILAGDKSGEIGKLAQNVVLTKRSLRHEFLSYTKEHPSLVDNNGNPRLVFYFNDEELECWLIRVVKGLFYHHNKHRIDERTTYHVKKYTDLLPQPSHTFPMERGLEFRPYFVYGVIQEDNADFWLLIFYDHLMFSVTADFTKVNKMHNQGIHRTAYSRR